MIYFDSETCGLTGIMVLLQYAEDDGEITLHHVWKEPVQKTLDILEWFTKNEVCAFNISFDWFHVSKLYTIFDLVSDKTQPPNLDEIVSLEREGVKNNKCLKPVAALDLMLYARKGPYQAMMDRKPIKIKRVPLILADKLCDELNNRIKLDAIYFSKKKKDRHVQWKVQHIEKDGEIIYPDFRNVVLSFGASTSLKNIVVHALGKDVTQFKEIEIEDCYKVTNEKAYAPFAEVYNCVPLKGTWPTVLKHHINHWAKSTLAQKYARDDVVYLRELHAFFGKDIPVGDDDSELAVMVGACRWRGYEIDIAALKKLREKREESLFKIIENSDGTKVKVEIPTSPAGARAYLHAVLDDIERELVGKGTGKGILEKLKQWKNEDNSPHKVAIRAKEVADARTANYEIDLFNKLIEAGRFHPDFKVIGALSSRMSGGSSEE